MTRRPFFVLGVQQIALGSSDRQELRSLWVDRLGLTPVSVYRSPAENVDEEILRVGLDLAEVEIDLMQPVDPAARPVTHTPALHHVGLWIDVLPTAVCWLVTHGVRLAPGGIRRGATGHDVCFIHPRSSSWFPISGNGVLIELVQAPPELVARHAALRARASVAQ